MLQHKQLPIINGAVPPPEILRGIDEIVPSAAARLIALAEQESNHRRSLEVKAIEANIAAQVAQTQINERQTKAVFRSDMIGQVAGFGLFVLYRGSSLSWA